MNTLDAHLYFYVLIGGFTGLLLGFFLWKISGINSKKNGLDQLLEPLSDLKAENLLQAEKIQQITTTLDRVQQQKYELSGENKTLSQQYQELKFYTQNLEENNQDMAKSLHLLENNKEIFQKKLEENITQLNHAQCELVQERERLQKDDKMRQEKALLDVSRAWADHEENVNFRLKQVCRREIINFPYFHNKNLPQNFSGKIKPDFCIEFLGQFLVFDAKKSKNIAIYIKDQVQKTALKYKDQSQIYPTIYFVVPPSDIDKMSEVFFTQGRFSFLIISPSDIFGTLFLLKKITTYQQLTEFDPQDRETMIRLITHYQRHIDFQNAANMILAEKSGEFLAQREELPKDFQIDLKNYRSHMPPIRLKDSDMRELMQKTL